jgi:uncharacterized SAM-binding protein YcdF (DUF218 family)
MLAFTRIPFDWHRYLGEYATDYEFEPSSIVLLGGSGMPSESNLIRLYYCARAARVFPEIPIVIVHPHDSATADLMFAYLVEAGICRSRIRHVNKGTNTREQAIYLAEEMDTDKEGLVLITSPENMLRSVKVFRKAGFTYVGALPAFENAMFVKPED